MSGLRDKLKCLLLSPFTGMREMAHDALESQNRERIRLRDELSETQKLFPLVMKHRNGEKWSREEKQKIRRRLRGMADVSPYLLLFAMPGGFFLMPLLAWWLDRRRSTRRRRRTEGPPGAPED